MILRRELVIVMMMETSVAGGGETNSFRNNKYVEYKEGMAFHMFKTSDSKTITPERGQRWMRYIIPH